MCPKPFIFKLSLYYLSYVLTVNSGKAGCVNTVSAVNNRAQTVGLIKLLISSEAKFVCVLYCDCSASLCLPLWRPHVPPSSCLTSPSLHWPLTFQTSPPRPTRSSQHMHWFCTLPKHGGFCIQQRRIGQWCRSHFNPFLKVCMFAVIRLQ